MKTKVRSTVLYAFAVALGLAAGSMLGGCAGLPIRDANDVRHLVSAADVLVANVAPICEAASPVPREHPCLALPPVTRGLERVRAALAEGNEQAAIEAWHRVAGHVEALAGVLQ